MPPINLNTCAVKIAWSDHETYPTIMRNVNVKVKYPGQKDPIANVEAIFIDRKQMQDSRNFYTIMDISEEHKTFATQLFDVDGIFRDKFTSHHHHRGTGCWGNGEMNAGRLLYIGTVCVNKEYRRMGIASLAVNSLLSSTRISMTDIVAVMPGVIYTQADDPNAQPAISLAFFHKLNFRRVGRTMFLAYSPDPVHPSRSLLVQDDVPGNDDLHSSKNEDDYGLEELLCEFTPNGVQRSRIDRVYATRYPLHHAIAQGKPTLRELAQILHSAQLATLYQRDRDGFTPLHIAAKTLNFLAVRTLLSLRATMPLQPTDSSVLTYDLLNARNNVLGSTPLELCEEGLLSQREMLECRFQDAGEALWPGYNEDGLKIAYALRLAMEEDLGSVQTEDEFVKLKRWGCTCGGCDDGWLSKRLRFSFQKAAQIIHDEINDKLLSLDSGRVDQITAYCISYLPLSIRSRLSPKFLVGYTQLFKLMTTLIPDLDIPTSSNLVDYIRGAPLTAEFKPIRNGFFSGGGKIEWALDCITSRACTKYVDHIAEEQGWDGLPRCKNDKAFYLARTRMGIPLDERWMSCTSVEMLEEARMRRIASTPNLMQLEREFMRALELSS